MPRRAIAALTVMGATWAPRASCPMVRSAAMRRASRQSANQCRSIAGAGTSSRPPAPDRAVPGEARDLVGIERRQVPEVGELALHQLLAEALQRRHFGVDRRHA